jgi:hypothetical protein
MAMQNVRPIHISGFSRQTNDFYSTPDWVTTCLLRHVALRGPVWEPCCGDGAIARVIESAGYRVVASDFTDYGYGAGGVDFFSSCALPAGCRALVTNPPYGDGGGQSRAANVSVSMLRFVRHGLDLAEQANGQLALLVRFQWIAGKRAAALLSSGPLDTVIALTKRIRWFDRGALTNSGQHHHCWIVFDFQRDTTASPSLLFAQ